MKNIKPYIFNLNVLVVLVFFIAVVVSSLLIKDSVQPIVTKADNPSFSYGAPAANCDYYASPTGTSGGDGSSNNPWDLHTALHNTAEITAGKTLCLKGGTYVGRYASNIAGTANSPVVIRSAPGEWAKIDGNYSTTLTADFGVNDTVVQVSDVSGLPSASEVFGFIIDNEILRIYGRTGNTLNVYDRRGPGIPNGPAHHSAGAVGLVSTPIFAINGAYTMVRDFEITNSDTDRINLDAERGAGINTTVVGTKIINMVIHDVGHPGIGFWEQVGDGGEIYGSLVWGVGIYDHDGTWTRGSALYTQNQNGTRYIRDNIWFRNFTGGVSIFTTNGYVNGFHVEGNISFDHRNSQNFWAGSQNINPIERLKMISNYGYHRGPYSVDPQTDFSIGYTTANTDAEVRDNRMVSNNVTFGSSKFANLIFTGNTVYLRPGVGQAQVNIDQETRQSYTINNNRYYGDDRFTSIQACNCIMDFVTWQQQTGFDANSTFTASAPPDEYFVRPNSYEQGRANIAVYNWSGASSVSVDISNAGLVNGQTYEIRDAQNFFAAPIVTGTYNGSPVNIPMNLTAVANLVGNITHINNVNQHTAPEFGAFVLLPTSAVAPDTTAPTVLITAPSNSATVSGSTTVVSASAADNVGVAGVQFKLDGSNLGSEDTSAPYSIVWNTTQASNATHSITAVARDSAGNSTTSTEITVTVNNTSAPTGGGGGGGSSGGGGGGSPTTPSTTTAGLVNSSGTYYLLTGGYRKGVTSPGILYSCGFEFKDARLATSADLALPSSLLLPCGGALVKSTQDPTVYLISSGRRYAFTSASVFLGLGFKFSSVLTVTNPELQALPQGDNLSSPSAAHLPEVDINIDGTIYWIDTSFTKHPYPSLEIWNSWHRDGDFTTVVPANQNDLNLTTGDNVGMRVVQ